MEDNLIDDIFHSDDEDDVPVISKPAPLPVVANVDNLFDSDDEDGGGIVGESPKKNGDANALFDSDDESNEGPVRPKKLKRRRNQSDEAIRSKKSRRRGDKGRLKKKSGDDGKKGGGGDSGNEYDSGEEVPENKDDRAFIDELDDHGDLMKEYDEDRQDFDDEEPDRRKKSTKRSQKASGGDSGGAKGTDPLSIALMEAKTPKIKEWSDTDKQLFVERLQISMRNAADKDDISMANGRPALEKLAMLPTVTQAFGMKSVWNTMLDRDILGTLRDWIMPKVDNTLPSLPVRSLIYQILLRLPCQADHLKRRDGTGRSPVGHILMQLQRHPMETEDNRRVLKDITDKWSRDIFGKSVENRSGLVGYAQDRDVQAALAKRYFQTQQQQQQQQLAQSKQEQSLRARLPINHGHMFTVQPDLAKAINTAEKRQSNAAEKDESIRAKILKKTEKTRGATKGNMRAMSVSVARPNTDV
jgi:transcription factor SPN1